MYVSLRHLDNFFFQYRPTPDDPTTKYVVMKPLGNIPTLHLRFWYGPHGSLMDYNFQIFDPETNDAIHAPKGLVVQFHHTGRWHEFSSLPDILRRCWDLPATPRFILPEMWHTNPGTLVRKLVRFSDGSCCCTKCTCG